VIDVSNPALPVEIASCKTLGQAEEIAIANGIAYVSNYDAGLIMLSLAGKQREPGPNLETGEL
jgi:hypothetical protein